MGELTNCPSSFAEISILGFVSMYLKRRAAANFAFVKSGAKAVALPICKPPKVIAANVLEKTEYKSKHKQDS